MMSVSVRLHNIYLGVCVIVGSLLGAIYVCKGRYVFGALLVVSSATVIVLVFRNRGSLRGSSE